MERCSGITQKGTKCKKYIHKNNNIINDNYYCNVHFIHTINKTTQSNNTIVPPKNIKDTSNNKIKKNMKDTSNNKIENDPKAQTNETQKDILLNNEPDYNFEDFINEDNLKGLTSEEIKYIINDMKVIATPIPQPILKSVSVPQPISTKITIIPDYLLDFIPLEMIDCVNHLQIEELESIFIPPDEYIYGIYSIFECSCCFCENFEKDKVICSEGHDVCRECLKKYVSDRITGGDYKLQCMADTNCHGFYNHKLLQKMLDSKLYAGYVEKEFQEVINSANLENSYTCPKCCVYTTIIDKLYIDALKEPKFTCLNPTCKYVSCILCKDHFHGNINCAYLKKDQSIRTMIEEILTTNRSRSCPKCNKHFIRIDGCNHMKCPCGTQTCYYCRNVWLGKNHKENKCPQYTSEKEIDDMSFKKSLDEIYDKFKNDGVKLFDEVYPIMIELEKNQKNLIDNKFLDQ